MSTSLCIAMGLDKQDLMGQLLAVEEFHGSDANFVLSCTMVDQLQKDNGVCLVALHNSFGHYHNVIMKLSGYNLCQLVDKGFVNTVEPLKMISNELGNVDSKGCHLCFCDGDRECLVQELFQMIKSKVEELLSKRGSVCVVIDDLSDLLAVGVPVKDVLSFLQYCRTLLFIFPGLSLVVLSHVCEVNDNQSLLTAALTHVADITVRVAGFKTGCFSDVSGTIKVKHKARENTEFHQWNEQNYYHFKLQDRQIKMFAPGTYTTIS